MNTCYCMTKYSKYSSITAAQGMPLKRHDHLQPLVGSHWPVPVSLACEQGHAPIMGDAPCSSCKCDNHGRPLCGFLMHPHLVSPFPHGSEGDGGRDQRVGLMQSHVAFASMREQQPWFTWGDVAQCTIIYNTNVSYEAVEVIYDILLPVFY